MAAASEEGGFVDARTRKMAGLAIIAVGIVLAVVGGLADQVGIGANDEGDMGGKQIAALVVGLLLIAAGIVVAMVLAKEGDEGDAVASSGPAVAAGTGSDVTPAAGTPLVEVDEVDEVEEATDDAAGAAEAEPAEVTESGD
jgi:hypothetical protein